MSSRTSSFRTLVPVSLAAFWTIIFSPGVALATTGGGGGLPWESSFSAILDSIQGMAPIFVTIAIIIAGLALMFGESGGMSRKIVGIVVGGAAVIGVSSVVSTLFQGASGTLI